jgi:hypothetical protein
LVLVLLVPVVLDVLLVLCVPVSGIQKEGEETTSKCK